MAVFAYQAVGTSAKPVRGTIAADTARQARDLLRDQGLRVKSIEEKRAQAGKSWWSKPATRGASGYQLASMARELGTMLRVGVPLTEALDTLIEQQSGRFETALRLVRDRVGGGASLAEAFGEQTDVFDEMTVRLTEVGENTGQLDAVLGRLADYKERSLEVKDRVIGALLYPAIVFVTAMFVTVFLMAFVTPMLLAGLIEAGRPLPWPTRVLKGLSDLLTTHGWWLAILAVVAAIAFSIAISTRSGRVRWHRLLLRLPLVGEMARKQAISRIAMVLSTLLESGVPFVRGIEIAARSGRNLVIEEALKEATDQIAAGVNLDDAIRETRLFPPLVVHIFAVGQESGELDGMLRNLAESYDRQVASAASRLTALLEPALIVALAVVVGFILFATLLPILEAGNVL